MEKIENEITAAEARKIAETGIGEALRTELKKLFEKINFASKANNLSVRHDGQISDRAKQYLGDRAFKIEFDPGFTDQRDPRESTPSYYVISW